MGNTICLRWGDHQPDSWLKLSNGLTSVLLDALLLSGSALARSQREQELLVWLARRDQNVFGLGCVGFALTELPWLVASFEPDRAFLLRVVEGALARTGWERLDYSPNEEMLFPKLSQLAQLLRRFAPEDIDQSVYTGWCEELVQWHAGGDFPRCPHHGILLHIAGCLICNDSDSPLYGRL